ncbi:two-component system, OmpR family, sensor histidine kinase BaeS [Anaerolineae bacterium]|nr:two-component system, OmpR family, sensor histidine kinase BaeS [Anaerolineae bacterium]
MMVKQIRQHLSWKIFLSYLIVIVVGVSVLATAANFAAPGAFDRHIAAMGSMMGSSMNMSDLFNNFRDAVGEALALAALAAFAVAIVVSVLVSRQIVAPVRAMMLASQRIAAAHYDERVRVSDPTAPDELDGLAISFNQMAVRLEQTETMRRQLLGDVVHELRTPLTSIKGYMEGLIDGVLPANEDTYQQVYREADRLQRLVHDLQELSRVEAGAYLLNLQAIEVNHLIETVKTRLERQFEEKGVSLQFDVPTNLPRVQVDEDRIGQVLINLVGNALHYTPSGGSVRVVAHQLSREIQIAVIDTGIGIPAEHLPQIFTRFYRVDKSRSRVGGGSGIGLTIARHLVEAHGGRIWVTSDGADQGSTFTFTLPVA